MNVDFGQKTIEENHQIQMDTESNRAVYSRIVNGTRRWLNKRQLREILGEVDPPESHAYLTRLAD